jgi:hypothetical protein
MEPHYPSSPVRPPKAHFYFTGLKPDGSEHFFFTHAYGAMYAAHHWLNHILDNAEGKASWLNNNVIRIKHPNGYSLIIKGELEEAAEYTPTKEEKLWTPPFPDSRQLNRATMYHIPKEELSPKPTSPTEEPKEKPTPKPPRRHKSTKPAPEGHITVAQIAESLDIQPNKARNILRKSGIAKPAGGWTFKINDPQVQKITELLKKG